MIDSKILDLYDFENLPKANSLYTEYRPTLLDEIQVRDIISNDFRSGTILGEARTVRLCDIIVYFSSSAIKIRDKFDKSLFIDFRELTKIYASCIISDLKYNLVVGYKKLADIFDSILSDESNRIFGVIYWSSKYTHRENKYKGLVTSYLITCTPYVIIDAILNRKISDKIINDTIRLGLHGEVTYSNLNISLCFPDIDNLSHDEYLEHLRRIFLDIRDVVNIWYLENPDIYDNSIRNFRDSILVNLEEYKVSPNHDLGWFRLNKVKLYSLVNKITIDYGNQEYLDIPEFLITIMFKLGYRGKLSKMLEMYDSLGNFTDNIKSCNRDYLFNLTDRPELLDDTYSEYQIHEYGLIRDTIQYIVIYFLELKMMNNIMNGESEELYTRMFIASKEYKIPSDQELINFYELQSKYTIESLFDEAMSMMDKLNKYGYSEV